MEWLSKADTKKFIEIDKQSCYISESLLMGLDGSSRMANAKVAFENGQLYLRQCDDGIEMFQNDSVKQNMKFRTALIGFFGEEIIGTWYFDIGEIDGEKDLVGTKY